MYEQFLYIISAIFIPLGVIQCMDYFVFHYQTTKAIDCPNLIIWFISFIFYECLLNLNCPLGYTIPSILRVVILCEIVSYSKKILKERLDND